MVGAATIAIMALWTVTACVASSPAKHPAPFESPYSFPAFAKCPPTPPPSVNHPAICEPATIGPYSIVVVGVRGGFHSMGTTRNGEQAPSPSQFIAVEASVTNLSASPVVVPEASAIGSSGVTGSPLTRPYDDVDINAIPHGRTAHVAYVFTQPDTAHLTWIDFTQQSGAPTIRIWLTE